MLNIFSVNEKSTHESKHIHVSKAIIQYEIKDKAASAILESVQDFLIKLDMKPCMNLMEMSIFSLNIVIVRPTKIMKRADKNWAQF